MNGNSPAAGLDGVCDGAVLDVADVPAGRRRGLVHRIRDGHGVLHHAKHRQVVIRVAEDEGILWRHAEIIAQEQHARALVPTRGHHVGEADAHGRS